MVGFAQDLEDSGLSDMEACELMGVSHRVLRDFISGAKTPHPNQYAPLIQLQEDMLFFDSCLDAGMIPELHPSAYAKLILDRQQDSGMVASRTQDLPGV